MRITRVFFGVNLGQGFQGLGEVAKEAKAKIDEDTTLLFINRRLTAFKMLRGKDYLVYYKNEGRRIPIDALRFLPQNFGGAVMEFDLAIKKSLIEKLSLKK